MFRGGTSPPPAVYGHSNTSLGTAPVHGLAMWFCRKCMLDGALQQVEGLAGGENSSVAMESQNLATRLNLLFPNVAFFDQGWGKIGFCSGGGGRSTPPP